MKTFHFLMAIVLLFACQQKQSTSLEEKRFTPDWESLSQHEAAPEWFADAKLGIYFHWGPYAVPAYGSAWYPCNMFLRGSKVNKFHEGKFGKIEDFGYEKFIPMFTAEHFDPEDWANLFQSAGAQFAGPVAQHHDGFAMWQSEVNPWNASDMGPKRDILGDLYQALGKRNMKTIATFHHARNGQRNAKNPDHWGRNGYNSHYPYAPDLPTATTDPKLRKLYGNFEDIEEFNQYWLDQVNEVVDKYSPDIIWYDSWLNLIPEKYRMEMAAHHFNNGLKNGKEVVLCHKQEDLPLNMSVLDIEQGGKKDIYPLPWMTDITLGDTRWMYVEGHPYKPASLVLRNMIDVWSKNGIVLLNVSPRADGVINKEQRGILKQIGDWLKVHGEAVYASRPHTVFGFGPASSKDGSHGGQSSKIEYTANDVRFTVAKDKKAMYVFLLGKPKAGKRMQFRSIGGFHRNIPPGKIKSVTLLGSDVKVNWELTPASFYITMPDAEFNDMAQVFKLELEGETSV
ncbi:alpha-L-fucosidase [Persicobacter diffluens]|uniref:alpha-L-fucosidase n=1 Tax=Persicobacter diffluens TaxID=981 RepID=A0AAN4W224_9BACT|nr:hypothetical protein PEDI_30470 [Persicobacter diffluens]